MDEMQNVVGEMVAGSIEVHVGDVGDQDESDEQRNKFMPWVIKPKLCDNICRAEAAASTPYTS